MARYKTDKDPEKSEAHSSPQYWTRLLSRTVESLAGCSHPNPVPFYCFEQGKRVNVVNVCSRCGSFASRAKEFAWQVPGLVQRLSHQKVRATAAGEDEGGTR